MKRGTIVKAKRPLDPCGANVKEGDIGVVVGEADCYGDGGGPVVQWFAVGEDGRVGIAGICNVYDGDVEVTVEPD